MGLRRLLLLACVVAGCSPPLVVKRGDALLPPADAPACHLVVWWRDLGRSAEPAPPPDAGARAAKALRADRSRRACRELPTWQVVESPSTVALLSRVWRPPGPVLWVSVDHARTGEKDDRRLQLKVSSRLQAGLFDTAEPAPPLLAEAAPGGYDSALARLLSSARPQPRLATVSIRRGEGPRAAEAFAAAERGEWARSAALWAEAAAANRDDLTAAANASAAYELAGELEKALEWHGRLLDASQGLGGMFRLMMLFGGDGTEREAMLAGRLSQSEPPLAAFGPGATLAVLPLDNETPDMDADDKVRSAVVSSLRTAGYSPVEPATVDERLKAEGVTMAGHLKALKWDRIGKRVKAEFLVAGAIEEYRKLPQKQVRVRLSLIHAPTSREIYAGTGESIEFGKKTRAGQPGPVILTLGLSLKDDLREAAERFVRPLPHFAK
ncbi:MAG: DUF799 family lipoprotein [Elusimicrobia bacterium]|nr:DUF799 family lipoprotein [Elusimicrobiota bacterium]